MTCVIALVFPVYLGAVQSWSFATSWPNATAFIAALRPLAAHSSGPMLVEDPSIAKYYLPSGQRLAVAGPAPAPSSCPPGRSPGTRPPRQGSAAPGNASIFAKYIARGYFSYVALNFTDTTALDHGLATELHRNPSYHTISVVPYGIEVKPVGLGTYVIWKYEPPPG